MLRDHQPVPINDFNGLWARGDVDNTPMDHFADCNNIKFPGNSSFATRDGIGLSQDAGVALSNIKRIYNYPTQTANTTIVLVADGTVGRIYHVVNNSLVYGPILSINGMQDFAFLPYNGRAYISPFATFDVGGLNVEKGLQGEYLYVYAGDGTPARLAAGQPLDGILLIANGNPGHTDQGFHLFGFVAESISGYLTPPGAITGFTTLSNFSVSFGNVPTVGINVTINGQTIVSSLLYSSEETYDEDDIFIPPTIFLKEESIDEIIRQDNLLTIFPFSTSTTVANPFYIRRHLVATKVITNFNGDPRGYQFFFVPDAIINNNTDTFLNNISFYDQDLLDDASHLFDNYPQIPAGAVLSNYHNRLCLFATYTDISLGLISSPGEPEAISQIDGLVIVPPDGNPITNAQEVRDVLYVTKRSRTVSFTDNDEEPAFWPYGVIDTALGTSVHGIATVLDSGGVNVDYLIVATYQGLTIFNGRYVTPELSWKIESFWKSLDRNEFRKIQIVNAPIQKEIYTILPTRQLLVGNYANGFDYKKIRWSPQSFVMGVNTIGIVNIDEIVIGADIS